MAPPVYEPDEVGVEPEVRMGRVCDEDSQAQRHDSVSSVERNVLAVDPGRAAHDAAKKGLLWAARTRRLGALSRVRDRAAASRAGCGAVDDPNPKTRVLLRRLRVAVAPRRLPPGEAAGSHVVALRFSHGRAGGREPAQRGVPRDAQEHGHGTRAEVLPEGQTGRLLAGADQARGEHPRQTGAPSVVPSTGPSRMSAETSTCCTSTRGAATCSR